MYIKHLVGSRAGEIEDVIFENAKAKVLAGLAEDVYEQLGPKKKPVEPAVQNVRAETVNVETKRKRR